MVLYSRFAWCCVYVLGVWCAQRSERKRERERRCVCKMDAIRMGWLRAHWGRESDPVAVMPGELHHTCLIKGTRLVCVCMGFKGSEGLDFQEVFTNSEEQSSLHCSTVAEESGEKRACMAHRAEHPIRHLHVVLKPIGSLQLRLKIDNCRREQQGEKAFWETWTHLIPHPPTPSIIEKDEKIGWRICMWEKKKKVCCWFPTLKHECYGSGGCGQGCIRRLQ